MTDLRREGHEAMLGSADGLCARTIDGERCGEPPDDPIHSQGGEGARMTGKAEIDAWRKVSCPECGQAPELDCVNRATWERRGRPHAARVAAVCSEGTATDRRRDGHRFVGCDPKRICWPHYSKGPACHLDGCGEPRSSPIHSQGEPVEGAIYPCADCGVMRTKAQGGTTFTVCDTCWDKHWAKRSAPTAPPEREPERRIDGLTREDWWRKFSEIGQNSHERTDMASMFCDLLDAAFTDK